MNPRRLCAVTDRDPRMRLDEIELQPRAGPMERPPVGARAKEAGTDLAHVVV
jgi:hypothetical protein